MTVLRTRRERVRDMTVLEIRTAARRLLVDRGPEALTVRAVAREVGMTAPALYRYYDGLDELVAAVCEDILDDLTAEIVAARDEVPVGDPIGRLGSACRAFRRWALAHRREFQLSFATPLSFTIDEVPERESSEQLLEDLGFGAVFFGIFVELWEQHPFSVPADSDLAPELLRQLERFRVATGGLLPVGALLAYLSGWVRLYGAVTIEVFGHLSFAYDDAEPMFEAMLVEMAGQLTT